MMMFSAMTMKVPEADLRDGVADEGEDGPARQQLQEERGGVQHTELAQERWPEPACAATHWARARRGGAGDREGRGEGPAL